MRGLTDEDRQRPRETALACPACGFAGPHLGTPVHLLIECRCGVSTALFDLVRGDAVGFAGRVKGR